MKKLMVFITFLILLFVLFIYFFFRKTNYIIKYEIDGIKVKEQYNKELEYYEFYFTYKDNNFMMISYDSYENKRKLISKVRIIKENDLLCIHPKSKYISTYKMCISDNSLVSPWIDVSSKKNKYDNFKNYEIYDLDDKKFLLWNYDEFILIDKERKEKIKLFDKDLYNLKLVYAFDNFLVVPDHEKDYNYDKLFLIDVNKNKIKEINLRYELYFDSYFLGYNKNLLYLYDKKQEQEYYINIKKSKIFKTNNKVLINNKWRKVTTKELKEDNITFETIDVNNYKIINNKLYSYVGDEKYLTLISSLDVKNIVKVDKLDVYFISEDTLYKYNPYIGIKAIISYYEWNFNYNNMVFIFD